jgi:hypothetical protein
VNDPLTLDCLVAPRSFRLSGEEWLAILRQLERFHAVFYKLWKIGMPVFTDQVETAAVHFKKGGDFVQFLFSPDYWLRCTAYERLFVICHEALHLILNHGVRTRDAADKHATNIALDIVVNHLLVRSFGFERGRIRNWRELCWVDTVFRQPDGRLTAHQGRPIPDDECFEHYLALIEKLAGPTSTSGLPGADARVRTVDDHSGLGEVDTAEVIAWVEEGLSDEEIRHFEGLIQPASQGSDGAGGLWHVASGKKAKQKRPWESVINQWVRKRLRQRLTEVEQWARPGRRLRLLPGGLFLPSEAEADRVSERKGKLKVRLYLDTSASCWHLKDRFFAAALSIPKDRFEVKLFCFDTRVVPTDLEGRVMCGGGGTSFRIIEEDIQRAMTEDRAEGRQGEYPDAVFVMTDGYGDRVQPARPERWYWLIDGATEYTFKGVVGRYVPPECSVFNLADFA